MVVIRLARHGSIHRPKYRVTVADSRRSRNGKFIEQVGTFNPSPVGQEKKIVLKMDRVDYWVKQGAQPSDRVKKIIKEATI